MQPIAGGADLARIAEQVLVSRAYLASKGAQG
jgi:hypothetical protein